MATKDNSRVTKDRSARKSSSILAHVEAKADVNRYQFIIKTLQEELDQAYESCEATHAEEIARVKAAHAEETSAAQSQHQYAVAAAVRAATSDRDHQIQQLKDCITDGERKFKELQTMFQAELEKKKDEIVTHKAEAGCVREQARNTDNGRVRKIQDLNTKVAIEIRFSCKGGSTRTYLRRPAKRLVDAVKELCKDIGRPVQRTQLFICNMAVESIRRHEFKNATGVRELSPVTKTLQELSISDGEEIWFTKL